MVARAPKGEARALGLKDPKPPVKLVPVLPNADGFEAPPSDENGLADPELAVTVANGDAELPDIAPNVDCAKSELVVPPPKRFLPVAAAVAKGDLAEVFANPLPAGIYKIIYILG